MFEPTDSSLHYMRHPKYPEYGVVMVYGTFQTNLMLTEGWSEITAKEYQDARTMGFYGAQACQPRTT